MVVQGSSTGEHPKLDPRTVRFVLVEPRSGGNVGAAARALKNFGFSRLVLVRPACDPRGREARMMAVDAADVLEALEVCDALDDALSGASTVLGLTCRTGKQRRPHYVLERIAAAAVRLAMAGELALVLGREHSGLSDEELDRCTHLVHVATDVAYASLNLAQAVLLVAYELRRTAPPAGAREPTQRLADQASRERFYAHLERSLGAIGFLTRDSVGPIMRRVRRIYGRAEMTAEEVRLLHGVARQTLWLARRAGLLTVEPGDLPRELPPPEPTD